MSNSGGPRTGIVQRIWELITLPLDGTSVARLTPYCTAIHMHASDSTSKWHYHAWKFCRTISRRNHFKSAGSCVMFACDLRPMQQHDKQLVLTVPGSFAALFSTYHYCRENEN